MPLKFFFSLFIFACSPVLVSYVYASSSAVTHEAMNDPILKKRVQFWIDIYTKYSTNEGLIHDAKYPSIVYEKLDLRLKGKRNSVNQVKAFYKQTLLSIHKKLRIKEPLNAVENRIFDLFQPIEEENKFFNAAHSKRIRFQLGQKENFYSGLRSSGKYIKTMEKIFQERGVPIEITRLPFVESSFNLKARSKVGASGIWQFMRSTGKNFLVINSSTDERNDPLKATEAAAELLKQNYLTLGSWPLAITAYNHGRKGLMRATKKLGTTQIKDLIFLYRSRSFGFASSNFYCELVAALEVEKNAELHFPGFKRDEPVLFDEVSLPNSIFFKDLVAYSQISKDSLKELNPALTEEVFLSKKRVPKGFELKIPVGMKENFLERYAKMPY